QPDGRQGGEDARIALHHAVLHRHVEVFADQHALTGEVEIGHLQNGHGQSFTGAGYLGELATASKCCATSSIRLAKPHSLSNQASRLTRRGPETRVWLPSTMAEWASWLKSQLACGSSV